MRKTNKMRKINLMTGNLIIQWEKVEVKIHFRIFIFVLFLQQIIGIFC